MPSQKYALTKGGPKRLEISWGVFSQKRTIKLDSKELGVIPDQKALKEGWELTSKNGIRLSIKNGGWGSPLDIRINDQPLPDSNADPQRILKTAYQVIFFLGAINIVVGIGLVLTVPSPSRSPDLDGLSAILTGIIYFVLGFFVRRRSQIALGLTITGFVIDTIAILLLGTASVGPLVVRFFLLLPMLRAFGAIRQLKEDTSGSYKVGKNQPGSSKYQSFLDVPEESSASTKTGILENFTRLELALSVTIGLLVMLGIGVVIGLMVSGQNAPFTDEGSPQVAARPTLRPNWTATPFLSPTPSMTPTPSSTPTPLPPSPIITWAFPVVDADYSLSLDQIVMVSDEPNQIHIYNPVTKTDVSVDLPFEPICVSVSPDGKFAAVGHEKSISYVDLETHTLVKSLDVRYPVSDIVLAGNSWIYVASDESPFGSHHFLSGVEIATNFQVAGAIDHTVESLKLSANGHDLYGLMYGEEKISHTDTAVIPLSLTNESDFGQYYKYPQSCSSVFLSADAQRLFSNCGSVLQTSSNLKDDLIPEKSHLEGFNSDISYVRHLTHSLAAGKILVVVGKGKTKYGSPEYTSNQLVLFNYDPLQREETLTLPDFVADNQAYPAFGLFVFVNAAGSNYYVIARGDREGGILEDYGLIIGQLEASASAVPVTDNLTTPTTTVVINESAISATPVPNIAPEIQLSASLTKIIFDDQNQMAYGLDAVNRKLWLIDLATRAQIGSVDLLSEPSDACLDPDRQTLFIVNWGSTLITEFDLKTREAVGDIYWPAPEEATQNEHKWDYDIFCQPDYLLLNDARFSPQPWLVDLNDPEHPVTAIKTPEVNVGSSPTPSGIGELIFTPDGSHFYYWYQWGWDAGFQWSEVFEARLEGDQLVNMQESETEYPAYGRDPLDTPIFVDLSADRLISKRLVMGAQDLRQIYFTFPEDEDIYAVDWARQRAASKNIIYDLTTLRPIAQIPSPEVDQLYYAQDGKLYILSNAEAILYIMEPQ